MKALITGVTGFVGGFLAEHLLAAGDEVLGASGSGTWSSDTRPELSQRVPVLVWDIGTEDGLSSEAAEQIERFAPRCIYHLAALSLPSLCGGTVPNRRALSVNVEGTTRVLRLARSLPERPRVLFVSTSHVYQPPSKRGLRLAEDAPLEGKGGYGKSKCMAEEVVADAVNRGELDILVARSFQHTGPRQAANMMLPEWAEQFARGGNGPVRVFNRDTHIDLTDVRDVVRAYRLLVERTAAGQTYNVGSGVNRRTGDVLACLQRMAGPEREIIELRPGERLDPIADNTRLTEATGWRAEIEIEQTVADTWEYWRRRSALGTEQTQIEQIRISKS